MAKPLAFHNDTSGSQTSMLSDSISGPGSIPSVAALTNSSAAVIFLEEAFKSHDSSTTAETFSSLNNATYYMPDRKTRSTMVNKLAKLLLPIASASILVETYFDRIHWFTLIFHKSQFTQKFETLYQELAERPKSVITDVGFLSLLLAVFAISFDYIAPKEVQALELKGLVPKLYRDEIVAALKTNILEIVALGSLEAVQTCILLGNFYLYRGEQELAWPICGCGLRIAQALNLHRRMTKAPNADNHAISTKTRTWWAIYDIETFCSMLYGFPLSISDLDCDVDLMDPNDRLSTAVDGKLQGAVTPLSYKYEMSRLSCIVREALKDL
jgi:hypothetical protein